MSTIRSRAGFGCSGRRISAAGRFRVQVNSQVLGLDLDRSATVGNIDFGDPQDGVYDHAALIVDAPVLVIMAAGEAESPAAIGALHGPGNDLLVGRILGKHG